MEILHKCFFYGLNDIVSFKKFNVFDLRIEQSVKNQETVFDTGNELFHVSFPNKPALNYLTHVILENAINLDYQVFIIRKLHNMIESLGKDKTPLSKEHDISHLVVILDISSSWGETINTNEFMSSKDKLDVGKTTIIRVSLLQILDSIDVSEASTFQRILQFFEKYLSSPTSINSFFTNLLHLDPTLYNFTALVLDNLTFLGIHEEPQMIELTRKSKLNNIAKSSEKTQFEFRQLLQFMDYLNELHKTLGTLIVTTSYHI